ncbi:MAG: hypothetical protein RL172_1286 [Bacteroidota bacterium]|jgi:predicted metal-dependent HD superfamily phosphohydrolase
MNYVQLLEEIKDYVVNQFAANECGRLQYHNLAHTQQVVGNAIKIANYYQLKDADFFTVVAAAWFHDAGYGNGKAFGHEQEGAQIAEAFLKDKGLDKPLLDAVIGCILSTTLPQTPTNLLQQIICDADLYHLGTESFAERNKLMRKEMEHRLGTSITKQQWRKGTIALMEAHHYHTSYAHTFLQATKNNNLQKLKTKADAIADTEIAEVDTLEEESAEKKEIKKEKDNRPERGIETLFRITSSNNQRLSDMADNKANIMITTTSIIMSVLLSVLIRKLEENPNLTIPAILLLLVCVATMVLAILSTRPSLPPGTFTQEEVKNRTANLLFFGNFYKMPLQEYAEGMNEIMKDKDFLYGSLTKDIYSQGAVLGKKYQLLRAAYNVFMFGMIISVIAFIVAAFFPG